MSCRSGPCMPYLMILRLCFWQHDMLLTEMKQSGGFSFLGRDFLDLGELVIERGVTGAPTEFAPQQFYAKAEKCKLHRYGEGNFCKFRVTGLPNESGVYVFVAEGTPRYVGKAINLKQRFGMGYGSISPRNCFQGGQQTNCRINKLVLDLAKEGRPIRLLVHACTDHDSFESLLIGHLNPPWNRSSGSS